MGLQTNTYSFFSFPGMCGIKEKDTGRAYLGQSNSLRNEPARQTQAYWQGFIYTRGRWVLLTPTSKVEGSSLPPPAAGRCSFGSEVGKEGQRSHEGSYFYYQSVTNSIRSRCDEA